MVKIRNLIAAEEALEAAESEYRKFNDDPRQWMAYESLDKRGKAAPEHPVWAFRAPRRAVAEH